MTNLEKEKSEQGTANIFLARKSIVSEITEMVKNSLFRFLVFTCILSVFFMQPLSELVKIKAIY